MIRAAFWLVKPQTQDIRSKHAFTPYMWVDYLWTTLRPSWAQAAEGLWESEQNAPSELIRPGRAGYFLWKGFLEAFPPSGRFARRLESGPTPVCPRRRRSGAW